LSNTAIVFTVVLVVAVTLFAYFLARRVQYLLLGVPEHRLDQPLVRLAGLLALVLGQQKVLKRPVGIIHFFIFWGFIVIAFGTLQVIAEGVRQGATLPWGGNAVFNLVKDILSVLVLIGLLVAAYIRYAVRPKRLDATLEAGVILSLIFFLVLSELLYSGFSYALEPTHGRSLAFVAVAISRLAGASGASSGTMQLTAHALWWVHVALLLGFLVYIPVSKHLHLIACPINEFLRNLKPRGAQIYPVDLESEEVEEFGVGRIEGFTRKQLLDVFACAECGRCQDNCPASVSGKVLSPKLLHTKLKHQLLSRGEELRKAKAASGARTGVTGTTVTKTAEAPTSTAEAPPAEVLSSNLIGDVFSEQEIWACTTCYACQDQCPIQNEHVNKIIEMRRNLVLMEGRFPKPAGLVFKNVEVNGNPLGESALVRGDFLRKLRVPTIGENPEAEVLYWPGCMGSLEARNQKVTAAFVDLLNMAGVSIATLGNEERCCGETVRRLGNEYLYQSLALGNIDTLNRYEVKKIVTQCPHCFNTLKNEYSQLGGEYEVLHHAEFLCELVESGRLKVGRAREAGSPSVQRRRVTYHDSCYLGRYNGIFDPPRRLLQTAGHDLVELPRRRSQAFCCGAGGGRMWLDEDEGERINVLRTDEVLGVMPDIAAVACPFCLTMLKDGVDHREAADRVHVLDVAEVVRLSLT
jgi:Fe-S oxidoreductase